MHERARESAEAQERAFRERLRQVTQSPEVGTAGEELSRLAELKDPWPHLGAEFERLNPRHLARRVPPGVTLS